MCVVPGSIPGWALVIFINSTTVWQQLVSTLNLAIHHSSFQVSVLPSLLLTFAGIPITKRGVAESFICTEIGRKGKDVLLPG